MILKRHCERPQQYGDGGHEISAKCCLCLTDGVQMSSSSDKQLAQALPNPWRSSNTPHLPRKRQQKRASSRAPSIQGQEWSRTLDTSGERPSRLSHSACYRVAVLVACAATVDVWRRVWASASTRRRSNWWWCTGTGAVTPRRHRDGKINNAQQLCTTATS